LEKADNNQPTSESADLLLYRYLPIALIFGGLQFFGAWLWTLDRYRYRRWLGGLCIACGALAFIGLGSLWAYGDWLFLFTLGWL
jgi:hypothetical protein